MNDLSLNFYNYRKMAWWDYGGLVSEELNIDSDRL